MRLVKQTASVQTLLNGDRVADHKSMFASQKATGRDVKLAALAKSMIKATSPKQAKAQK